MKAQGNTAGWYLVSVAIVVVMGCLVLACVPVHAHDAKAMASAAAGDSGRLDWFTSLHAPNTDWCCDNKDAEQLPQDRVRQLGATWWVRLPDLGWTAVPANRVVKKPSIDGEPYLFRSSIDPLTKAHYALDGSPSGIRCFVPPIPGY